MGNVFSLRRPSPICYTTPYLSFYLLLSQQAAVTAGLLLFMHPVCGMNPAPRPAAVGSFSFALSLQGEALGLSGSCLDALLRACGEVWSCLCLLSAVLVVLGLWVYLSCALV